MAPAVERREHIGRGLPDRSMSPVKSRHSPRRKSSPQRERSPTRRRSPPTDRSPKRASSSHRKSPPKEKVPGRVRSPTHARTSSSRSPSPRTKRLRRSHAEREPEMPKGGEHSKISREEWSKGGERVLEQRRRTSSSRSPSPRSKRLMRAQAKGDGEKVKEREHRKNYGREEPDKGGHGEQGGARYALSERSSRDKNDGGSSRTSRRDQSFSPQERNHRRKHDPCSPSRTRGLDEVSKSRAIEQFRDDNLDSVAKMKVAEESLEANEKDKQKPSFELSGKLAEETNRVRGVTLLFNEPADARKPDVRWRLYVFKAGEVLNEPLYVHRQTCYLFGRERRVADIPTDHPSCSKQHAVIQYRLVETKQVRPYLMDLGSTNGTFINDNRIEAQRYYELFEKDTIRFGNSSREYVMLHENSAT